ncbi:MAG: class I SAM-dependent methyltransferase [Phycisphaerae bacterium]
MSTTAASPDLVLESRAAEGSGAPRALRACLLCHAPLKPYASIPARRLNDWFYTKNLRDLVPTLHYSVCPTCRSLWAVDGRRDESLLSEIYADLPTEYWAEMSNDQRFYETVDNLLERFAHGRRLCDVGCGDGKLLRGLSECWEKYGLEPGHVAAGICRSYGYDVVVGTPLSSAKRDAYDAVTCIDTIEHMLDPAGEVAAMARTLRANGILLIITGDAGAWTARLAGPWWEYLHCVGHVSVLSRRALLSYVMRAGLRVIRRETVSHYAGVKPGPWLVELVRNYWRRARGHGYRPLRYCRDHQMILARKV